MSSRNLRLFAWLTFGITSFLFAAILIFFWLSHHQPMLPVSVINEFSGNLFWALFSVIASLSGLVITLKRPGNRYGWVWLFMGLAFIYLIATGVYGMWGFYIMPGHLPFVLLIASSSGSAWVLTMGLTCFAILLYPSGGLPSERWRWLAWIAIMATLISMLLGWAMPGQAGTLPVDNPYAAKGNLGTLVYYAVSIMVFVIFGSILLGVVSLVVRYRRANGTEQQQLKWFALGAAYFGIFLVSDFFIELPGIWESIKETLSFAVLPVAIAIGILRYRLYDIDVIIRRTLIYAALTVTLALLYFGSVVLLEELFQIVTGQHQSPIATVISTLTIAALFTPLRRRIQRDIDRRFYRKKYDAQKTLESFAARARDEVELDQLTAHLVAAVQETMQPEQVSLWLRKPRP
jgi:hypothetical protein